MAVGVSVAVAVSVAVDVAVSVAVAVKVGVGVAATVSESTAQPTEGRSVPLQALAVVEVGTSRGPPPPPTRALLVKIPLASALTLVVKLNTLVPLSAAITDELVQVITLLDAVQLQLAACVPLKVRAPLLTANPVGKTSTNVMVPLVATAPVLLTVKV